MRLRSLEIQGFKSFPDKTKLEFDNGITAVVGPNGSGKSNIADAVRWVLGEQSTKTLRGNRMEDVIFGGTQSRKAMGHSTVQITIDNSDRRLDVEGDEVTISRKLYRSGESEYRLCGAMVRLKDIHELLMDTGLGRDGYSIIGQGRIAEIVSAKSNARREIFEEAAGISKYRYRKVEAERKLEQAEENLLRLRDILLELESRVGPLKAQAEKARDFLRLSEEKRSLEISLWMLNLDSLREQLAGQQDKIYLCKNEYEQLEGEAQGIEDKINEVYERSQALNMQAEEYRAKIRELEDTLSKSEAEIAVLGNDIRHNELSIKRVDSELDSAGLGVDELNDQLAEKQQALEESAGEAVVLQNKIEALEDRLTEQREAAARVEEEIRQLTVRRTSAEQAINETRLEKAAGATRLEETISRLEALRGNSGEHGKAVEELEDSIAECRKQIAEQEERLAALENTGKGYALKRESRGKKQQELSARIQELQNTAGQKRQRAKLLSDMEASMEGFAGSVKYILSQAGKGALSGVYGPVSSLISTGAEYTTAIETVLGAAMQNVVVENEDTAKRAIRMLQGAKAGRATFLPVTSVKGRRMEERELGRHDGYIGLAVALVQYDAKFSGVMDQLLGRVAVVEDLDAGTRIAKASGYKFRIVTLDGQVINAGGAFTGGSTARSAGVLGRRQEIEKLEAEIAELRRQADALAPEQKALEEELAALDAEIGGARAEYQTASEEKTRLGFSLEQLLKSLEQAKHNRELVEQELEGLTQRLEQMRGSDVTAEELLREMEAKLDSLTGQLEAATARRDTMAVGTETAAQQLTEQKMVQLAAGKDQDLLAAEIERIRLQIESAGTRAQQLQEEKVHLAEQNQEIARHIREVEQRKVELGGQIAGYNDEIAGLLRRRTELEAETTELRNQERELSGKREGVSRELARLEERKTAVQAEYEGIIAKLWDEYELTRSQAAELVIELEDKDKAGRQLTELRSKIRGLGTVNVEAIEEYAEVSERYEFLAGQVRDVEQSKAQLQKMIGELTDEMRQLFLENFTKIADNFSRIFVELFGGGKGELTLTSEEDVLESGVDIYVQPPGKVIKNLSLLSGGEQAFVAIAIYFAILKVKPAPFCLLDEIEAALDDVNVTKFANYLRQMCGNTQFIAITHRRGTMEEADVLYGVTMQDEGVSKLLELKVTEVETQLGI